jgi:uncharacterized protein (TIRG00374 family)
VLGWVIWSNWQPAKGHGLKEAWEKHVVGGQPLSYRSLGLALAVGLVSVLVTFVRWYVLVRAQRLPFTLPDAFRLGAVGFFFNSFLPGSVGGDVIKAAFLAREQSRRTVAVATVLMDRAIALWALLAFVGLLGAGFWLVGILSADSTQAARIIVVTSLALTVVCAGIWILAGLPPAELSDRLTRYLVRVPRVGAGASDLWRAVRMYLRQPRAVCLVIVLSWIGHAGFVLTYYLCVQAVWDPDTGPIPRLTDHFLLVPVGLVIQAVPGLPGGLGLGEFGFGQLYEWFGCPADIAVLGSLVQRVVNWVIGLAGYLVCLRWRPVKELEPQPAQAGQPVVHPGTGAVRPVHGA